MHISKKSSTFAPDLINNHLKLKVMKEFYVTFFGDVCGIVEADIKMYGKSLNSIKNKIRDHANKLNKGIDLVQVYNCTDDKLHEAHLKSLNFHAI